MNPETLRKIFKSPFDYTTYSNEIVHQGKRIKILENRCDINRQGCVINNRPAVQF